MATNNIYENPQIQETVAKLMAIENISVEHQNVRTPCFDVHNRRLVLPTWKNISPDTYSHFISHEVGHALFTESSEFRSALDSNPKLRTTINIVEDARVDKLIKRRFPGVKRSYAISSRDLFNANFFGTEGKKPSEMSLLDRFNLHFKVASYTDIDLGFSDAEQALINRIEKAEEFSEVLEISKDLYALAKAEKEEKQQEEQPGARQESQQEKQQEDEQPGQQLGGFDQEEEESNEKEESSSNGEQGEGDLEEDAESTKDSASEESEESEESEGNEKKEDSLEGGSKSEQSPTGAEEDEFEEPEAETVQAESDSMNQFVDSQAKETIYCEVPEFNLNHFVVGYKQVHSEFSECIKTYNAPEDLGYIEAQTAKFIRASLPTINYMVKEFEMRKAAQNQHRTATSKTGILDTNKMFSYRYNEDIFRSMTKVADGKNHGIVMFFDMSGSMERHYAGTLQQILNLVMFCRKVNIPFEVYGFSDNYESFRAIHHEDSFSCMSAAGGQASFSVRAKSADDYAEGEMTFVPGMSFRQYFSNKMSGNEVKEAIKNICAVILAYKKRGRRGICLPRAEYLRGTPLNEAILVSKDVIKKFQKVNRVDIVSAIFLTDGASNSFSVGSMVKNSGGSWEHQNAGGYYQEKKAVIRCANTKRQYTIEYGGYNMTKKFLMLLKDSTACNLLGIYVTEDPYSFYRMIGEEYSHHNNGVVTTAGFDEFYVVPGAEKIQINKTEFDDLDGSTHGAIGQNFQEKFSSSIKNRVILSKFIDKISRKIVDNPRKI